MTAYNNEDIRKLLLTHLKAFVLHYLNPTQETYTDFVNAHQDMDDAAYTIWDEECLANTTAEDDDEEEIQTQLALPR